MFPVLSWCKMLYFVNFECFWLFLAILLIFEVFWSIFKKNRIFLQFSTFGAPKDRKTPKNNRKPKELHQFIKTHDETHRVGIFFVIFGHFCPFLAIFDHFWPVLVKSRATNWNLEGPEWPPKMNFFKFFFFHLSLWGFFCMKTQFLGPKNSIFIVVHAHLWWKNGSWSPKCGAVPAPLIPMMCCVCVVYL